MWEISFGLCCTKVVAWPRSEKNGVRDAYAKSVQTMV